VANTECAPKDNDFAMPKITADWINDAKTAFTLKLQSDPEKT